jgi:hypothetical protein
MENNKEKMFSQSIDFYWRSTTVYAVILIIYSLMIGSIEEGTLMLKIFDPVVILLSIIIIVTSITMISRYYRQRTIIIGTDYIRFKSRFGSKTFTRSQIQEIKYTSEKIFKTRRKYSILKIKLYTKKNPIRIRPSAFENQAELIAEIHKFETKL